MSSCVHRRGANVARESGRSAPAKLTAVARLDISVPLKTRSDLRFCEDTLPKPAQPRSANKVYADVHRGNGTGGSESRPDAVTCDDGPIAQSQTFFVARTWRENPGGRGAPASWRGCTPPWPPGVYCARQEHTPLPELATGLTSAGSEGWPLGGTDMTPWTP